MNFFIEHQCPQCGAPAVLEENERLFSCGFCRVKSYLLGDGFFRYCFPHSVSDDKKLFFFPYWRFKGLVFSSKPDGIEHRFIDISHQAFRSPHFPVSVGLRSQALKLRFAVSGTPGGFVVPQMPVQQVMRYVEELVSPANAETVLHRTFIGDSLSMIYSPYYLEEKLFDAVLKEARSTGAAAVSEIDTYPREDARWTLRFIPALCPNCGRDLEGRKESLALTCANCQSVWHTGDHGLRKLNFGLMGVADEQTYFLPVWRIRAKVSGLELDSHADLVKLANLPRVIRPEMKTRRFHFWVQAFKIRPQRFLQFSTGLTVAQPGGELRAAVPAADRSHPVTLPATEALEALKIILAAFIKPARMLLPILPEIRIAPEEYTLVFLPFTDNGRELVQPDYRIAVDKNSLTMARGI